MAEEQRPIIVRKVVKKAAEGHHGGAWKVAYADFVTAMMAFFLLMWLLNATTEDKLKGLADYFDPQLPISRVSAGGASMLHGDSPLTIERAAGTRDEGERARPKDTEPGSKRDNRPKQPPQGETAAEQTARLDRLGEEISAALEADGGLERHFMVRMTPEGLAIEIVDADDSALFDSGAASASTLLTRLVDVLAPVIGLVKNRLAVVGHTDATPFGRGAYGNWELSADRANTARRLLERAGIAPDRVARVTGRAATAPLVDDPRAPENRRISIVLMRDSAD